MLKIWLFLVPAVFLFVAAINEGDRFIYTSEYFLILRLVVSVCCVIIAMQAHKIIRPCSRIKYVRCLILFGFILIVFNPFIPLYYLLYFRRIIIYIIAGVSFIVCGFLVNWLREKTSPICDKTETQLIDMRKGLD